MTKNVEVKNGITDLSNRFQEIQNEVEFKIQEDSLQKGRAKTELWILRKENRFNSHNYNPKTKNYKFTFFRYVI